MDVFDAMADPVRRDLLRVLATGPTRVVDLAAGRAISRPAVSKHLRVLTDTGLVVADDHGRERHYRLRPDGLAPVAELVADLAPWAAPAPATPHVTLPVGAAALDALDLEVRRVGRDRRSDGRRHDGPGREDGESA
jgi:DNA-binding transcriptional ArsR family regulator